LPDVYVEKYGQSLRSHVLDVDTEIIKAYHLYNGRTGFNAFFDKNTKRYRTGVELSGSQQMILKSIRILCKFLVII